MKSWTEAKTSNCRWAYHQQSAENTSGSLRRSAGPKNLFHEGNGTNGTAGSNNGRSAQNNPSPKVD